MRNGSFRTMRSKLIRATALAILLATNLFSGCTLFSPLASDMRVEVIDKLPHHLPQREPHAATLLILPPNSNPVYDTIGIAYRTKPHQVDYFSRHQWGATPAQMLQPLLARTLENTHYFEAVLTPPYFGSYRYALRTEIIELIQDFTSSPAALHFTLRVQLIDGTSNQIISSTTVALYEPIQSETPYAGVVATNDAAAQALGQIAGFVLNNVR